jgi:hypothetical protein
VSLITDLVEGDPLQVTPYAELRCRLLAAHQLTDIQPVEQLHQLPPLANQKSSELLAEMLRLCPRVQENNAFFNCLFLNKLPRELRILLSEADKVDKQALGARSDLFAAHYSKQALDVQLANGHVSSPGAGGEGHHGGRSASRGLQQSAWRWKWTTRQQVEKKDKARMQWKL